MRAAALALVALCLPVAATLAAEGPGSLGPANSPVPMNTGELGPCAAESGAASFDRIAACTDLIRIGKVRYEVYVARASAYADSGDPAAAVADLTVAIKLQPDAAAAYAMRGALYLKDEAFRDGLVDLDTALTLSPGDEEALRARAFVWDGLGAYPAAIADYTALLALTHDDSYRYFRGFAYARHGEPGRAVIDFEAILNAPSPTLAAWGYRGRGLVREEAGALDAALADYTAALSLDPSDDRAYAGRCRMAAALGIRTEARVCSALAAVRR
jgi:tetratricopeptide (TPR) repeat protein